MALKGGTAGNRTLAHGGDTGRNGRELVSESSDPLPSGLPLMLPDAQACPTRSLRAARGPRTAPNAVQHKVVTPALNAAPGPWLPTRVAPGPEVAVLSRVGNPDSRRVAALSWRGSVSGVCDVPPLIPRRPWAQDTGKGQGCHQEPGPDFGFRVVGNSPTTSSSRDRQERGCACAGFLGRALSRRRRDSARPCLPDGSQLFVFLADPLLRQLFPFGFILLAQRAGLFETEKGE